MNEIQPDVTIHLVFQLSPSQQSTIKFGVKEYTRRDFGDTLVNVLNKLAPETPVISVDTTIDDAGNKTDLTIVIRGPVTSIPHENLLLLQPYCAWMQ